MREPGRGWVVVAACAVPVLLAGCRMLGGESGDPVAPPQVSPAPGRESEAFSRLEHAVGEYMALRRAAVAGVPALKAGVDAATIAAHQRALAEAIRARRRGARAGEIFAPATATAIARLVKEELASVADERQKVAKENPRVETPRTAIALKVNADYPAAASVSTMPPGLLLRLPRLPEGVEYRFVGKHLVLCDVDANLIIDYLLSAAP
jgi:hypothetical protein